MSSELRIYDTIRSTDRRKGLVHNWTEYNIAQPKHYHGAWATQLAMSPYPQWYDTLINDTAIANGNNTIDAKGNNLGLPPHDGEAKQPVPDRRYTGAMMYPKWVEHVVHSDDAESSPIVSIESKGNGSDAKRVTT